MQRSDDAGDDQAGLLIDDVAGCATYSAGGVHWPSRSLLKEIRLAPDLEPVPRLALQLMLFESARYAVACSRTRISVGE